MEKHGYEVTYLPVDENGLVDPKELEAAIRPETILITIMFANNEIGTVEPIEELGRIAHEHGVYFHTDAVQAFGHLPINVDKLNIDMLSSSAHKINGPKGIGFLYIRSGIKLSNLIHGGSQERGKRAGTTNAAGIIGYAKATELALKNMDEVISYESALRDRLIDRVLKEIPYSRVNGDREKRLSNNANFCFRFVEGESLLILLDQKGILASSGSACTSGSLDPSHVLLAIGLPHEIAHGSVRLTLSSETTQEDIDYIEKRANGGFPDITFLMEEGMSPEKIIDMFLGDPEICFLSGSEVSYKCNCSEEKMSAGLATLSRADLEELANDPKGIDVECHFCDKKYNISKDELNKLAKQVRKKQ